jgi:ankyrin repeat protein
MKTLKGHSIVSKLNKILDIWQACKQGNLDLVRILVSKGQDVNEQTQGFKNTPVHIAA